MMSSNNEVELIATAGFGLEAVVARELKGLGYSRQISRRRQGHVSCRSERDLPRQPLAPQRRPRVNQGRLVRGTRLRRALRPDGRPRLVAMDSRDGQFPVSGKSVRSQLHSVRDCQAIVKKAIVEKLKQTHRTAWFAERGPLFAVEVSILKDRRDALDRHDGARTAQAWLSHAGRSGSPQGDAGRALVQLSFWNRARPLAGSVLRHGYDPHRSGPAGAERGPWHRAARSPPKTGRADPKRLWHEARTEARDLAERGGTLSIVGSDIDEASLSMARRHAQNAGVEAGHPF